MTTPGAAPVDTLGQYGESALIAAIRERFGEVQPLDVGIGDDGAVFHHPQPMIAVADAMMEGVHFDRTWSPAEAVGRKLVAVNVSDIAAMGGVPTYALFTASLPRDLPWTWVLSLLDGVAAEATRANMTVCGGDVTGSPGPVSLSLSVLGRLVSEKPLLRRSARVGQSVYVTGTLGGSALGLAALQTGVPRAELVPSAIVAHRTPTPRLEEGAALARWAGVGACMDLSDGLAQDAARLAAASGVALELDLDRIPPHPGLVLVSADRATHLMLHGGEDYELLFTGDGPPPCQATCIGRVAAGAGIVWRRDGAPVVLADDGGFSHF
ncbi:MAG: thiamine-phosphate kinase [Bradymonadia bacterium]